MFDIQVGELTVPGNYGLIDFGSVQPKNFELLAEQPEQHDREQRPEVGLRGGADRVSLQLADGPRLDVMLMPPGVAGSQSGMFQTKTGTL